MNEAGALDRHGEEVEDRLYNTKDFDRTLVIDDRTRLNAPDLDPAMVLCDQLEASLAAGNETRQRLPEAVLHQALEPAQAHELELA